MASKKLKYPQTVTLKQLHHADACWDACEWFKEKFGSKPVYIGKVARLALQEDHFSWVEWLLESEGLFGDIKPNRKEITAQTLRKLADKYEKTGSLTSDEEETLHKIADRDLDDDREILDILQEHFNTYDLRVLVDRMWPAKPKAKKKAAKA